MHYANAFQFSTLNGPFNSLFQSQAFPYDKENPSNLILILSAEDNDNRCAYLERIRLVLHQKQAQFNLGLLVLLLVVLLQSWLTVKYKFKWDNEVYSTYQSDAEGI
jgi:hypothetical protein